MGYHHMLCIKDAPIRRALKEDPTSKIEVAVEIGRAILDLTIHNSHKCGVCEARSMPFRGIPDVICSTGSTHLSDDSFFAWDDGRFYRAGSKASISPDQESKLIYRDSLGSPDRFITQFDDEISHYAWEDIKEGKAKLDDYEIPDAIASIYKIWEDETCAFITYDESKRFPIYKDIGLCAIDEMLFRIIPFKSPCSWYFRKFISILKPEFSLFWWNGAFKPVLDSSLFE